MKKVTPVIIAIIKKGNKYLMTKRYDPKEKQWHDKWQFPGGELEYGEEIIDCLKREIKEELNLEINILKLIPYVHTTRFYNSQVILVFYLCSVKDGKKIILDKEASTYGWFTVKQILKLHTLPDAKKLLHFV